MARPKLNPQVPGEEPQAEEPKQAEVVAEAEPQVKAEPDPVPDQADIDPKTISKPVLTKQGWVIPGA